MPLFPKQQPAAAIPACEACGALQPECVVPDGEGTLALCWPCAHAHVDHGCELGRCAVHECECLPTEIYPKNSAYYKVIANRRRVLVTRERTANAKPS